MGIGTAVNVDNDTLRRVPENQEAIETVLRIEGFRASRRQRRAIIDGEKQDLTEEEREYRSKRKQIQDKLIRFAARIPAFMYLTDFRENALQGVITRLEPDLFKAVTALSVEDFYLPVRLRVFNPEQMNQAVFRLPRIRGCLLVLHGHRLASGAHALRLYDTFVAREAGESP